MNDLLRQEVTATADRIVVKVGTRVVTRADGLLDDERIAELAGQLSQLVASGREVVLVSSGAVGAGMGELDLSTRPDDLAQLQAVAAIGQAKLIESYDRIFRQHDRHAAQLLLTAQDLDDRAGYLNVRNTLLALLQFGAIPVVNENDTVAVDELMTTFGDNDRLAALVTNLLGAQLLIILSNVPGLMDGDPADPATQRIGTVTELDESLDDYVTESTDLLGKGGMASKLEAARIVTTAGENMIIASGDEPDVLTRIIAGEDLGTLILAQGKTVSPWKRWIGFSAQPRGKLHLDAGACQALLEQGSSLLPIGISRLEGQFEKGDVIELIAPDSRQLARGLTNYSSSQVAKIIGLQSDLIAETLGQRPYVEVVHRDNLVLLD
jgi:glutamate 5-kinase